MSVNFTQQMQAAPELKARATDATSALQDVLGAYAGSVDATWDVKRDERGRPVLVLRLSDWSGGVSADFAPDELDRADHLRGRLYRLWGDLLQARSHQQVRDLLSELERANA